MTASDIVVTPVDGKADLKAFIQLPVRLFRGHKGYIPHLNTEREEAFSPKKNPLFKHVEVQFFLARRAGKVVGRITAQLDHAYLERYQDSTGHFGCLVAEDDPAIFAGSAHGPLGGVAIWSRMIMCGVAPDAPGRSRQRVTRH